MNKLYTTLSLIMIAAVSWAQPSTSDYIEMAQQAFDKKHYNGAISHSRVALEQDPKNADVLYLLIQSELALNAYVQAERHLKYLLDTLQVTDHPEAYLQLAVLKQSNGKYQDAIEAYSLYLSEYESEDEVLSRQARIGLNASKWAIKNSTNDKPDVTVNHLDIDVNSPYSEHAPVLYQNKLYFTSLRFPIEGDDYDPQRIGSKVINTENSVDRDFNLGKGEAFNSNDKLTSNLAFNDDESKMVYSLCTFGANDEIHCELYMRSKDARGVWMPSVKLPAFINEIGSTNTQACFGEKVEGVTDFYFVSNRKGQGGMDIYLSSFDESMEFSEPINLAVNSEMDDVTPYYNFKDKYLYFSSNGRDGYGGMDVYKTTPELEKVQNMGLSVNTSYNEIFYRSFKTDDGISSYLASNRPGSLYLEEKFETCCYDLYQVENEISEIQLLASTFDNVEKQPLNGTYIVLEQVENPAFRKEENLVDIHQHLFDLDANKSYSVMASKLGFEDAEVEIDSKSLLKALATGTLEKELYLQPLPVDLSLKTFKELDQSMLIGATAKLMASGYEEQLLTNANGNDFAFKMVPGVTYELLVSSEGFHDLKTTVLVPLDKMAALDKDVFLKKVTLMESLENLIPLSLYYDNDHPHPNSMRTTTDLKYSNTFESYYSRKNEFVETYTKQFKRSEREEKKYQLDQFFEQEVKKSYNEFNYFVSTLIKILVKGKTVNIYLRGYASPLSKNEYNNALGERRIASVKNEFLLHDGGILVPFIESGQLIITVRSFGEGTAAAGISDDPLNPENSIYSLEASKERRVEIDEIVEVK